MWPPKAAVDSRCSGGVRCYCLYLMAIRPVGPSMASRRRRRSAGASVVRVTAGRDRRAITRLLESLPRPVTTVFAARGRAAPIGVPPRSRLYERYKVLNRRSRLQKLDNRFELASWLRARSRLDRSAMLREQLPPLVRRCVARRQRREVIHALGVAGARGRAYKRNMRGARHTAFSQARC